MSLHHCGTVSIVAVCWLLHKVSYRFQTLTSMEQEPHASILCDCQAAAAAAVGLVPRVDCVGL